MLLMSLLNSLLPGQLLRRRLFYDWCEIGRLDTMASCLLTRLFEA